MQRPRQHVGGRPLLHHLAGVEHGHLVGDAAHDAEVVADEERGEAAPRLQLLQQVEDLRLDGDVEGGGRLVENEQIGFRGQRTGDQRALAHAAGQLMRIGAGHDRSLADADLAQQIDRARQRRLSRQTAMMDEPLADLRTHAHRGVEHREGILEHQRHAGAAQLAPALAVEC